MSGLLDVGTISGTIDLDDRLSNALNGVLGNIKKFGESVFGEFSGIALGVGATTTAVLGVTATIVSMATKGSAINAVSEGFDKLSGSVENGTAILEGMRIGVAGTVTDLELMTDANKLMSAGVNANAKDFESLTTAARILSQQGLGSVADVMARLDRAMQTGNANRLGTIGVTIDLKKAEADLAAAHDINLGSLTKLQIQEASRNAIIEATNKIVADAGPLTLTFAQQIGQLETALKNWTHELEGTISSSTHISSAFIQIKNAIVQAFGGDSQALQDKIVQWVNNFADAVATHGPPIIKILGDIKDAVVFVYDKVMAAWDAVPDWFKNIAANAALTALALDLTSKGIGTANSAWKDFAGIAANVSQASGITGKSLVETGGILSKLGTGFREVTAWGKDLITNTGSIGDVFDTLGSQTTKALEKIGLGFATATPIIGTFGAALSAAILPFAPLIIAVTAVAAVLAIGYQAWKLWGENAARAGDEARHTRDEQENLVWINDELGTSFKTIGEASKAWADHIKGVQTAVKETTPALTEHQLEVNKLALSLGNASVKTETVTEAFSKMSGAQKINAADFAIMQPLIDGMIAKGETLTSGLRDYYAVQVTSRINTEALNVARLAATGLTKDAIDADKLAGMSQAEIAEKYKTTVKALDDYSAHALTAIENTRTLTGSTLDVISKMHGDDIEDWIAGENRKADETIRAAHRAGTDSTAWLNAEAANHIANINAEIQKRSEQDVYSKAFYQHDYDMAKADLDLKLQDESNFTAEDIRLAEQTMTTKGRALNNWAQDSIAKRQAITNGNASATGQDNNLVDSMTAHWEALGETINSSVVKVKMLSGEIVSLQEAQKRFSMGGSFEVTAATFDSTLTGMGLSAAAGENLAKKGYSLAEIVSILHGLVPGPPVGPRITGFAEGGLVMVGEQGPEAVRLPFGSQVFPGGTSTGGGQAPVVHIAPGAIVLNYPIMRDRQSMIAIGSLFGDAILQRLTGQGVRVAR